MKALKILWITIALVFGFSATTNAQSPTETKKPLLTYYRDEPEKRPAAIAKAWGQKITVYQFTIDLFGNGKPRKAQPWREYDKHSDLLIVIINDDELRKKYNGLVNIEGGRITFISSGTNEQHAEFVNHCMDLLKQEFNVDLKMVDKKSVFGSSAHGTIFSLQEPGFVIYCTHKPRLWLSPQWRRKNTAQAYFVAAAASRPCRCLRNKAESS